MSDDDTVILAPLRPDDAAAAGEVWNAAFGRLHPLGPEAWRAWWASPDARSGDGRLAREAGGRPLGVIAWRAPVRSWSPRNLGHVALFAVRPEARRRGVGSALWRTAHEALVERGRTRVRIGGEPERWLPGVPTTAPAATWRFLARRGVRPGGLEVDLRLDLERPVDGPELPDGFELVDDAGEETLAFVARAFPGRWHDEAERYRAHGVTVLALRHDGRVVGFCVAHAPDDRPRGPGLLWSRDRDAYGLGPLGLDRALRGRGLGLALVAASARRQRARGATSARIDWTDLVAFYGRIGAHVWRTYQRAEGPLV